MKYSQTISGTTYTFDGLVELMAKATPRRSGDELAGCAAESDAERAAAAWQLADLPLTAFLDEQVVPYETDEVTRLIIDTHDRAAFQSVAHLSVGGMRDWLLETAAHTDSAERISAVAPGLTPEMVAAVSKFMRNQDLILVASAATVTATFRTTGSAFRVASARDYSPTTPPTIPVESPRQHWTDC